jgi:DNA-binding CsgD family transcriptional regulator
MKHQLSLSSQIENVFGLSQKRSSFNSSINLDSSPSSHFYIDEQDPDPDNLAYKFNLAERNAPLNYHTPILFVADLITMRYTYLSRDATKAITGYSSSQIPGPEVLLEKFPLPAQRIFADNIFNTELNILLQTPGRQRSDLVFTNSYVMQHKDGNLGGILQKYSFLCSPAGIPIGAYGYAENITAIADLRKMTQKIELNNIANHELVRDVLFQQEYFLYEEDTVLSKRELEILRYISDGLTSKEIAGKLSISEYTVVNHRKNMLRKTSVKSSSELINHAIKLGLL